MGRSIAEYKAALVATGGMQAQAAKRLGVTRGAVTNRIQKCEELQQVVQEQREAMLDEAEEGLRAAISDREAWAICFTLKTIGKDRGYVERQEHAGPGGKSIAIRVMYDDGRDGN